jgi:hypothetical protein
MKCAVFQFPSGPVTRVEPVRPLPYADQTGLSDAQSSAQTFTSWLKRATINALTLIGNWPVARLRPNSTRQASDWLKGVVRRFETCQDQWEGIVIGFAGQSAIKMQNRRRAHERCNQV